MVIKGVSPRKAVLMTPSAGLRVVTDTIVVPSVIDLVVTAALFVARLVTVFAHVAEEAYVVFLAAPMAMGHANEVRKDVLEDVVVVHGIGKRALILLHPPFQFFIAADHRLCGEAWNARRLIGV